MNQERSGKKGQESLPADLVKNKEASTVWPDPAMPSG